MASFTLFHLREFLLSMSRATPDLQQNRSQRFYGARHAAMKTRITRGRSPIFNGAAHSSHDGTTGDGHPSTGRRASRSQTVGTTTGAGS